MAHDPGEAWPGVFMGWVLSVGINDSRRALFPFRSTPSFALDTRALTEVWMWGCSPAPAEPPGHLWHVPHFREWDLRGGAWHHRQGCAEKHVLLSGERRRHRVTSLGEDEEEEAELARVRVGAASGCPQEPGIPSQPRSPSAQTLMKPPRLFA